MPDGLPPPPASWLAINKFGTIFLITPIHFMQQPNQVPPLPEISTPDFISGNIYPLQMNDPSCPLSTKPLLSDNINGISGLATYYAPSTPPCPMGCAPGSGTGHKTANGEFFDGSSMTAASPYIPGTTRPKYPFGTNIKVTDVNTGNSVVVRINDTGSFGKFADNRVIDLSAAAMKTLTGRLGSTHVTLEVA